MQPATRLLLLRTSGSQRSPDLGVPANERRLGGGEATEAAAEATAEEPPATVTTLLMRALRMEDSPVKIYGWIENSFTGNANGTPANGQNFGVNPNNKANQWMGNQYYLVVENKLEQTDEINFGFRVDNLFGNDWQFNYMQGLFNRAFVPGHLGYDLSQLYGEVHLPILTPGGLDVKGGLWYSLVGYEQVPAVARPLLSVPYMFNYGYPFRHVGVVTTWHLTDRINLYNGTINGWDRWIDERYIWGYTGGFAWTSRDAKTNVAFTCVTGPNQFPRFLPANQPNDWVQFGTPYNDGTRSSQLTLAFDVIFLFSIARSSGLFSSTNTACRIFSLPSDCRADTRKSIPDKEMWPSAFSSPRARACACSHVLSARSTARHNKHNRYGPRRGEGAGNGLEWPCL